MGAIVDVDDDSYETVIRDEPLVLLYFRTAWCGPCRVLDSALAELADRYPVLSARIDVDDAEAATDAFGVETVPTVILLEHGELVDVFAGPIPYPRLERRLQSYV